jgi:hypothetical protein
LREASFVGAVSEELRRLSSVEERHRRLLARLTLVVAATAVIDVCAAAAIYFLERHASVGQAFFFTTVQLLTVSSQLKNPITPAGRARRARALGGHHRRGSGGSDRGLLPKRGFVVTRHR